MTVTVRFAPSPTGYLHIGGARTALFNWLFARHHGGRYLLRIEDTDKARSTEAAIHAIHDGLSWLGLDGDEPAVLQSTRLGRHAAVVAELVAKGAAYPCYSSPQELALMRERQRAEGRPQGYDGTWRDRDPAEVPAGVAPAIRLKAPRTGETLIQDLVQGDVRVANEQLDDLVLLRADGTPTYMLSVVVDDHDMAITHIIRGDDHLTNAFRQTQIYLALGWTVPAFAHIPMIHGPDGAKLSKRHGALGVDAYREMGYLPEAVVNYLLRLGWSHGDDEIISREQAVGWFDLAQVGRSPSRFDVAKLENINGHYLREADDERLTRMVAERLGIDDAGRRDRLRNGMAGLKIRARTVNELAESACFYVAPRPLPLDAKAEKLMTPQARQILARTLSVLRGQADWSAASVEAAIRAAAEQWGLKLGGIAQPLRVALTGSTVSPGVFDVAAVLGRDETLARLADASGTAVAETP